MEFTEQIKELLERIRHFKLQEDRAILLSCFGIALIFWILVKLSQEYTSQKQVFFSYDTSSELALVEIPPEDVQVTLRGTGWNLMFEHLAESGIPIPLEVEEVGDFRLDRAQFRAAIQSALRSEELEIAEINYDEIQLDIEEKVSRKIPIKHRLNLDFAPEHHMRTAITMEPDSVTITGAVSLLDPIVSWPTDSFYFNQLASSVSTELSLSKPPPEIKMDVESILLNVPVEAYTEKSLFIPVSLKNPPADSLKVFPDKIKISFVVGLSRYDSIGYEDFILEANLSASSLEKGKNTVPVNLIKVPESIKNVVLSKNSVEFFILKPTGKAQTVDH